MARTKRVVPLLILLGASVPALAQSGWATLGQATADGQSDHQVIDVAAQNRSYQMMVCVEQHDIQIRNLDIRYRDGRTQHAQLSARLRKDNCSRMLVVGGHDHDVASVTVFYDPASLQGATALVQVATR
jgi:hypothetical protein